MYNIVIADDEQLECLVLRQALEKYLGGRCVIRMAANGREAVEAALLAEAHLVIMDIEMPGIKGLEAARIISQKLPHCKIIMLTAYSEFAYAHEAISYGSAAYLLKPCSDEELHRTLDRVLLQIDSHRASKEEKKRSIERIQNLSSQIEEQIVRTVMGGHINPGYILEQMKNYGVNFSGGVVAILYSTNMSDSKNVVSALKSCPWPEHIHPFLYCYDGKVYIVNVSDREGVNCLSVTADQFALLSGAAKTLWGRPLFGSIGKNFSNIQYAQLSCFQAQIALGRCTYDHPISIYEEESEARLSEFTDNPIINSVLFGDVEEIGRVTSSFISSLFAQQLDFESIISQLNIYLAKTVQSLRQQTGLIVSDIGIPTISEKMDMESLIHDVASRLCQLADQLLVQAETKDASHIQKVKSEIETYVSLHYSEDIFMSSVAREMNYSSAYFSKLFKQCFQRNFITYLTDVRINAAKKLMRNTDMTIREIGEKVGYKDPNYFTKVFRKVVDVSPSEYRSANISRDDGTRREL